MRVKVLENFKSDKKMYKKNDFIEGSELDEVIKNSPLEKLVNSRLVQVVDGGGKNKLEKNNLDADGNIIPPNKDEGDNQMVDKSSNQVPPSKAKK